MRRYILEMIRKLLKVSRVSHHPAHENDANVVGSAYLDNDGGSTEKRNNWNGSCRRHSWTLKLLARKVVQLELAESISPETVRQVLKKTNSSRGRTKSGASAM